MLVAALCHDIDHRGKNNAFQKTQNSSLAQVYENSSVMERHHFSCTMLILRQEKTNILASLEEDEYFYALEYVRLPRRCGALPNAARV